MARFLLAFAQFICLILAVGACAPVVAPRGLEDVPARISEDVFIARDGMHLPLRHWDAIRPQAIVVALHGMSDYSEAFDMPGPWWAEQGITTFAYDQRGFGTSPNPGIWAGADAMRADLDDFVDAARAKYPGVPVFALGESMGGAVVLSALAGAHPPQVDGVVLVAPAVWSRADMPASYRAALWLTAHIVPAMRVSGNGLHIVACDNRAVLRKLSRDPLFQHSSRIDQVFGLAQLMDEARLAPAKVGTLPRILFLYGAKDQIIPPPSTETVVRALGPSAEPKRYPGGYHMLLRDLEGEAVWADIREWIVARTKVLTNSPKTVH